MEGALGYDLLPYQGKLVVAGGFSYAGGMPANCLAVWDGQAWSTLDGVSPDYIVLALLATGEDLYIGGGFLHVGGINARRVAKWDGESWSGLGNGLNGSVTSLAAWNDGHGSILFASSTWERLAKWDGLAWTQIPGVSGAVTSLEVFDDGSGPALYVAGFFNSPAAKVAKWNGEQWSPLGQGITDPGGYAASLAVYDDGSGPALYMGGEFTEVDGISITNIARWNGQSWSRVGDPHLFPQDVVYPLRVLDDGSGPALFAGWVLQKWDGQVWTRYVPQPGPPGGMAMYPGPDGRLTLHVAGSINLGEYPEPNRYTNIARFTPAAGGFACGDFNGDGMVTQADLGILLAAFDNCPGPNCPGDANGDGVVDQQDLGILLAHFGQECS